MVLILFVSTCFVSSNCDANEIVSGTQCNQLVDLCNHSPSDADHSHSDTHCLVHCAHISLFTSEPLELSFQHPIAQTEFYYSFLYMSPSLGTLKRPPLAV